MEPARVLESAHELIAVEAIRGDDHMAVDRRCVVADPPRPAVPFAEAKRPCEAELLKLPQIDLDVAPMVAPVEVVPVPSRSRIEIPELDATGVCFGRELPRRSLQ